MNANHSLIANFFEEELNSPVKGNVKKKNQERKGLMCLELQSQMFLL